MTCSAFCKRASSEYSRCPSVVDGVPGAIEEEAAADMPSYASSASRSCSMSGRYAIRGATVAANRLGPGSKHQKMTFNGPPPLKIQSTTKRKKVVSAQCVIADCIVFRVGPAI